MTLMMTSRSNGFRDLALPTIESHARPARRGTALAALLASVLLTAGAAAAAETAPAAAPPCPEVLRHDFANLQSGEVESLCRYAGRVVLVVNTASRCGYTPQYEGLEALYTRYRDRGLVVLGFPSNDFGAQEPGSNARIAEFCRTEFGIEFPMFEKSAVSGRQANPLFADLARRTGRPPAWNFHKYLIDRAGTTVASFDSGVTPDSRTLVERIEQMLAEEPKS